MMSPTDPECNFVPAMTLRKGEKIVERDARGKRHVFRITDVERYGRYGHGYIVASVERQLWRYEPQAIVELA